MAATVVDVARRFWDGAEPLWKAFWVLLVGGSVVSTVAVIALVRAGMPQEAGLFAHLCFLVWAWVSVWRCAGHAGWQGWGFLARTLVVVSAALFIAAGGDYR